MESQRLLLGVLVFGVMIAVLALGKPTITGFVPTAAYSQGLDIEVSESQRYILKSSTGQSLGLNSLSLSGFVSGSGLVNVYLSDGSARLLVYSNKEKKRSAMEHITGLAVQNVLVLPGEKLETIETISDDYRTTTGGFQNECVNTCLLSVDFGSQAFLDIIVEPGASLALTELRFTVAE
ncbi:MAG TPA: hypothetical protein VI612_02760 [Candidatus Nanoarchaeia archaeon]|nr:hypothetical protein [Candidatus Nanoarchaeia archaeon]